MNVPHELIEQFSQGNGAVFIGAGLSIGAGLPSWGDLMERLKVELEDCPTGASYPDIAQYYEIRHGKNRLITRLREELDTYDVVPTPVHNALVRLKVSPIFTTNYDDLIEKALDEARIKFDTIVNTVDASFWSSDHLQLVKFHGDINQPATVVLTSEDYERYFPDHPALTRLLSTTLQTSTLLLLGYSATDIDFRLLLTQVQSESGVYARNAYAVMFDAPDLVVKDMERRGIKIINFQGIPPEDRSMQLGNWVNELGQQINEKKEALTKKATRKKLPKEPYKFLNWFGEEDIAIFHGRDYEIKRLVNLVESQRITVLYGESGTGKTSLLRAGVIPVLRDKGFYVTYFRPLTDPFRELGESLKSVFGVQAEAQVSIQDLAKNRLSKGKTLFIIADQFEEFFIRQGFNTRKDFELALKNILDIPGSHIHILLSLRSDYLDRLDEFEEIMGRDPLRSRIRLHNLGPSNASVAILEPAKDFEINLDQALLEKLVSDLGHGWIAPPQLQIVCYSLWKNWVDKGKPANGLTLESYFELGATEKILENYLTRVIQDLNNESILAELSITLQPELAQSTAKAILKSLITSERTKIAVSSREITQSELIQRLNILPDQINAILNFLQNRRIVRHVPDSQYYELVHEVMIGQVWSWVSDDERRILDMQDILRRAVTDYRRFQTLLSPEYLNLVSENIGNLSFNNDELELLLASAINYNYTPNIWVERMNSDHAIEILEKLISTGRKVLFPQISTALGYTKSPKAVRYLAEFCKNESRETQRTAAAAMARLNFHSVVPPLFHSLMREESLQRSAPFLEALEKIRHEEAVAMLMLVAMEHKDIGVRKRATNAVMRSDNLNRFKLLTKQLTSEDVLIRNTAVNALVTLAEERPRDLIDFYSEGSVETRIAVIRSLPGTKSRNAFELLAIAVADSDPGVRQAAILTIGQTRNEQSAQLLSGAINDDDPKLRSIAVSALSQFDREIFLNVIGDRLTDESAEVRSSIIKSLIALDNDRAAAMLVSMINDPDKANQQSIISSFFNRNNQYTRDALAQARFLDDLETQALIERILKEMQELNRLNQRVTLLKEGKPDVRLQAARELHDLDFEILKGFQPEEIIAPIYNNLRDQDAATSRVLRDFFEKIKFARKEESILAALADPNSKTRKQAVHELQKYRTEASYNAMLQGLNDVNMDVRVEALNSIGVFNDMRSVDILTNILRDANIKVRKKALYVLLNIIKSQSLSDLIESLKNGTLEVRRQSAMAMGELKDIRATDALITALNDEAPEVRREVITALGIIKDDRVADALQSRLDSDEEDHEMRKLILDALGHNGSIKAINSLVSVLNSADQELRKYSAVVLGRSKDPRLVDLLSDVFGSASVEVRRLGVAILRQLNNDRAVTLLIDFLDDKSDEVRRDALSALSLSREPRVVDAAIEALKDASVEVRMQAIQVLGHFKNDRSIAAMISALADDEIEVRLDAISLLRRWKDSRTVESLITALADRNAYMRQQAAISLGELKSIQALDALTLCLKDEVVEVRIQAVIALGNIRNSQSIDELGNMALGDIDPEVRQEAALSFGKMKNIATLDFLLKALKDEDDNVRQKAALSLGKLKNINSMDALLEAVHDESVEVRLEVIKTLGHFNDPRVIDAMAIALADDHVHVRQHAALVIFQSKNDTRATEAMIAAMSDKDVIVRQRISAKFITLKDPRSIDILLHALHDEDVKVRLQAVKGLEYFTDPRIVDALMASITDVDPKVRLQVINSLFKLKEKRAMPALSAALGDEDAKVRQQAEYAIKNLTEE